MTTLCATPQRLFAFTLVVALLTCILASTAQSKAATTTCDTPRYTTVKKTTTVRVSKDSKGHFYACLRSGSKIWTIQQYPPKRSLKPNFLIVGKFVIGTFPFSPACGSSCGADENFTAADTKITNLVTGQATRIQPQTTQVYRQLVATSTGKVAWTEAAGDSVEVFSLVNGRKSLLDSGGVEPTSLSLNGETLSWTKDGVTQSATLS